MVEMRKRTLLVALAILEVGLIGTGFSTLYKQNEYVEDITANRVMVKVSYGFPPGWYGYSNTRDIVFQKHTYFWDSGIHWFSSESLLLDAVFWFAISFFVCIATMKLVNMLHKKGASKNLSVINI